MDNRITQKDVSLNGHVYRVKKMDSRSGTWLYSFLTSKASPNGDPVTLMQLLTAFHGLDKSSFESIQTDLLKRTFLVEDREGNEFESVILAPNGSGFSFDWLTFDTASIYQLTDMGMLFNVSPFFPDRESSSSPPPA
jgi:hypothetical protein